eukprot:4209820-Prymnesium_polylepis.1
MRHASYTRKTWTTRHVPRGGVPVRNVTSWHSLARCDVSWPMADGGARGRYRAIRAPCGASGT